MTIAQLLNATKLDLDETLPYYAGWVGHCQFLVAEEPHRNASGVRQCVRSENECACCVSERDGEKQTHELRHLENGLESTLETWR